MQRNARLNLWYNYVNVSALLVRNINKDKYTRSRAQGKHFNLYVHTYNSCYKILKTVILS